MDKEVAAIKAWLGQGSINIFGLPFAGKDTQTGALADLLGAEELSSGHILRGSIMSKKARHILDTGGLVPTVEFIKIVLPFLGQEKYRGKPLLLSSVGRWHGEEQGAEQAAADSGHPIKAVIYLNISEELAKKRHAANTGAARGNRSDDAADFFDTRLDEFRHKTLPVIAYYRSKNLLIEIDGSAEPPEVTKNILQELYVKALCE